MNGDKRGCLYIVGTPIGNLGDITLRALETLRGVDFIACEDTRRTRKLLAHFGVEKDLVSLHAHSGAARVEIVIGRVESGESAAYVTDAGMPTLNDPGHELVSAAFERGLPLVVIPGPSALTTALAYTPFDATRFSYEGFLPRKGREREARLSAIARSLQPSVVFEAPTRIVKFLEDLERHCGGGRRVLLAREMTKLYESVACIRLGDWRAAGIVERGEYTVIVEGARNETESVVCESDMRRMRESVAALKQSGVSSRDILKVLRAFLPDIASELRGMVLEDDGDEG